MSNEKIDVAVIGGGVAGLSCALYAKRAGLSPVIFEKSGTGGQLLYISHIDNYPGLPFHTPGPELLKTLLDSVSTLKIKVKETRINRLSLKDEAVVLETGQDSHEASAVVIATGASFKKLGVKGEKPFSGKGVSWCAVCDGYFFKDKEVAVVGGGNTACEDALYLSHICKKVTVIHRRETFRAMQYLISRLKERNNIEVVFNSVVKEIKGADFVQEVVIESTIDGSCRFLPTQGLFIAIGIHPNTELCKGTVSMDADNFILTDEEMKSSEERIWACGDCRKRPLRQLITASAEGAIAGISVYKYLKGTYISV